MFLRYPLKIGQIPCHLNLISLHFCLTAFSRSSLMQELSNCLTFLSFSVQSYIFTESPLQMNEQNYNDKDK